MSVPNPGVAYVRAYINGQEITKPEYRRLTSFTYQWDTNVAGRAYFEFVDEDWTEIERLIQTNISKEMTFRFGWLGHEKDPKLWSKEHKIFYTDYKTQIFDRYATLSVDGGVVTPELREPGSKITTAGKQLTMVIKEKSVREVMRKLFGAIGFDTSLVEETKDFAKVHNSVDSTLADYPVFLINSQSEIQVFLNELRYWATTKDSGSGIAEELEGKIKGKTNNGLGGFYIYFIDSDPPKIGMSVDSDKTDTEIKASFDYPVNHKGKREVISFSYDSPVQALTTGAEGAERVFSVERFTGVGYSLRTQYHKVMPAVSGTQEIDIVIPDGINSAQKINYADGGRQGSVNALCQYVQASHGIKLSQFPGIGKLTIVGRTDLRIDDLISVNIWINRMDNGRSIKELHWQSGTWRIQGYTDTITNGSFTKTLQITKLSEITITPEVGSSVNLYSKNDFNIADDPEGGSLPLNTKNPKLLFTDSTGSGTENIG